jgi:hypothetical protein
MTYLTSYVWNTIDVRTSIGDFRLIWHIARLIAFSADIYISIPYRVKDALFVLFPRYTAANAMTDLVNRVDWGDR